MGKRKINTEYAPTPGNYNQAIKVDVGNGYLVYTAGQTGNIPPSRDEKEPVVEGGVGPQTTQTLRNLEAVLREAGGTTKDIIKTTVFLEDLDGDKAEFEKAYTQWFRDCGISKKYLPARSTVEAKVPLVTENTVVEIEAVAYIAKK